MLPKALILENSPIDAAFLRMMLERSKWHAQIISELSDFSALASKLEEHTIVFVNSQLGKLTTKEIIPQIKSIWKKNSTHGIIIAMLNSSLTTEVKEAVEAGADFCLIKPIYQHHLREIIEKLATKNAVAA